MPIEWIYGGIGGVLIGLASALVFLANGRICGISGIAGESLLRPRGAEWRPWFLVGLIGAAAIAFAVTPTSFALPSGVEMPTLAAAGLLVGLGTRMGNGCTSGHGVCGLSRLAPRSFVAVASFLGIAIATMDQVAKAADHGPMRVPADGHRPGPVS